MAAAEGKPPLELDPARDHGLEPSDVDEDAFLDVLEFAQRIVKEAGIPFGLLGGIASAALGRPRWTHDIDLFVRPEDAHRAIEQLATYGFETHRTNKHWLFKAFYDGVLVDVIFRAKGDIYLDDAMIERLRDTRFKGRRVRTIPPEDLVVIKAIIYEEESPRHWYDALGVIMTQDIDWEYLLTRTVSGPRRVLSLLVFAQSCDLTVPDSVVHRLFREAYPL